MNDDKAKRYGIATAKTWQLRLEASVFEHMLTPASTPERIRWPRSEVEAHLFVAELAIRDMERRTNPLRNIMRRFYRWLDHFCSMQTCIRTTTKSVCGYDPCAEWKFKLACWLEFKLRKHRKKFYRYD